MGNYDFTLDLDTINTMSIIANWITERSRILEFGPANGRLTKYLSEEKHCVLTIVEIDEASGREAGQYAEKSFLGKEKGDIEKYYWNDGDKYDFIIFADVLEHLSHPREVLLECKKILKESGKILISVPNIAHNSIIIDLCNDKFEYGKTGLLDKTHIHFFTYMTFVQLVESIGYEIYEKEYIYSRVGNNEIHNTYLDIPTEVSNYLRKRKAGSIYQYVFSIGFPNSDELNADEDTRLPLKEDYREALESKVYIGSALNEYSEENKISVYYNFDRVIRLCFDLRGREIHSSIRWDPLEFNVFMKLLSVIAVCKNGQRKSLQIFDNNAEEITDDFFLFLISDPQIFFSIDNADELIGLEMEFELLDYRYATDSPKVSQYIRLIKEEKRQLRYRQFCEEQISILKEIQEQVENRSKEIKCLLQNGVRGDQR